MANDAIVWTDREPGEAAKVARERTVRIAHAQRASITAHVNIQPDVADDELVLFRLPIVAKIDRRDDRHVVMNEHSPRRRLEADLLAGHDEASERWGHRRGEDDVVGGGAAGGVGAGFQVIQT